MATTTTTRKKTTAYQRLVKVKFRQCAGKATAADLKKAATAYVTDAVKKGKTKACATSTVSKLMKRGCSVAGKKKAVKKKTTARKSVARKPAARKTTRRRARA